MKGSKLNTEAQNIIWDHSRDCAKGLASAMEVMAQRVLDTGYTPFDVELVQEATPIGMKWYYRERDKEESATESDGLEFERAEAAANGRGAGMTTSAVLRAFLIALPCNGGKSVDVVSSRQDQSYVVSSRLRDIIREQHLWTIESASATHIKLLGGGKVRFYSVDGYNRARDKADHTIYDLNDERR